MTIGIYGIRNKIDNKIYIGKSKNIEARFYTHRKKLQEDERDKKQTNRHLFNAVKKYGYENFEFIILREIEQFDEDLLADLEIYYMDLFSSNNRDFGYNLRRDSATKTEVSEETRKLISENNKGVNNPNYGNKWSDELKRRVSLIKRQQVADGVYDFMQTEEYKAKISENSKRMWQDEEKKKAMAKKVSEAKRKYGFLEYDKVTGEFIREWSSMAEIIENNPDYHDKAIYSVCNGTKKSYRGSVWYYYLLDRD